MKRVLLLALAVMALAGCSTYQGGTTTETGAVRGSETDNTTSDFDRGEGFRNTLIHEERPTGGFHH
jgi:hypothetical protein